MSNNKFAIYFGELFYAPVDTPDEIVSMGCTANVRLVYNANDEEFSLTADNCGEVLKVTKSAASLTFDAFEVIDVDKFKDFFNASVVSTPATPVSGAEQEVDGFNYDNFILIENQNGDMTAPTINSVTGSVDGALTLTDDYLVVSIVKKGVTLWGIQMVSGTNITTEDQVLTIDYDYTPQAAEEANLVIGQVVAPYLRFLVYAVREDGSIYKIDIDRATITGEFGIDFRDVVDAQEYTGASVEVTAAQGANLTLTTTSV